MASDGRTHKWSKANRLPSLIKTTMAEHSVRYIGLNILKKMTNQIVIPRKKNMVNLYNFHIISLYIKCQT